MFELSLKQMRAKNVTYRYAHAEIGLSCERIRIPRALRK